jgi:hypothetical protein
VTQHDRTPAGVRSFREVIAFKGAGGLSTDQIAARLVVSAVLLRCA